MTANLESMIQDLVVVQRNQLSSDELVKARLMQHEDLISGLVTKYNDSIKRDDEQDLKPNTLKDRIDNLELNEEITDEQVRAIQERIKKRVSKVLNYPNGDSAIYYKTFIADIYSYLRNSYCLGSRTATTKKRNYDTVMVGIDAWYPDVEELKEKKNKREAAKLAKLNRKHRRGY